MPPPSNIREVFGQSAHSFNGTRRHPTILDLLTTRYLDHSPLNLKVRTIRGYVTFFHILQEPLSHSLGIRLQISFPSRKSQPLVSTEGRRIILPMEPHPLQPTFNGINPQHCLMAITPSLFHIWREQRLTLPLSRSIQTPPYRAKHLSWMTITLRLNILELGQEIRALSMRGLFRMVSP